MRFACDLGSCRVYFLRWEWEARADGLLEPSMLSNPRDSLCIDVHTAVEVMCVYGFVKEKEMEGGL